MTDLSNTPEEAPPEDTAAPEDAPVEVAPEPEAETPVAEAEPEVAPEPEPEAAPAPAPAPEEAPVVEPEPVAEPEVAPTEVAPEEPAPELAPEAAPVEEAPVEVVPEHAAASASFLGDVLASIDSAGTAMQAKLSALWVPWSEETQSGNVFWHASAAAHLQTALSDLAALRDRLAAVDWPETTKED